MGSGPRFEINKLNDQVGFGIYISKFPHQLSINISLILFNIYIGFGKGYDE
jgi:hypothetical protein